MTKKDKLLKVREKMLADDSLPLKKGANKLVFGAGNPEAEVLFIGEGPGYHEDQKGIPFVGRAGILLNKLLSSIKLDREEVFITNVVHYRPPNNRDPAPDELEAFSKYLDRIIKIIDPKVIVTLGRFSMRKFVPGVYISDVHGVPQEVKWKDRKLLVIPMYHPAAALRNGKILEAEKLDFLKIPNIINKRVEVSENNETVQTALM